MEDDPTSRCDACGQEPATWTCARCEKALCPACADPFPYTLAYLAASEDFGSHLNIPGVAALVTDFYGGDLGALCDKCGWRVVDAAQAQVHAR